MAQSWIFFFPGGQIKGNSKDCCAKAPACSCPCASSAAWEGGQGREMIPAASPAPGEVGGGVIHPEEQIQEGNPKALGVGGHPLQTGKVGGKIILLFLRSWEISSQPGLSSQLKHGSGGGFSHPDSSLRAHTAGKSIQGCQRPAPGAESLAGVREGHKMSSP